MAELLNTLLDRGVNLIDTAASYSGSEAAIGEAIGHRRDDYVLVSKCGQAFEDMRRRSPHCYGVVSVAASRSDSLSESSSSTKR